MFSMRNKIISELSLKYQPYLGLSLHVTLFQLYNPIALRKAKIVYNSGLSGCNRVNDQKVDDKILVCKV